MDFSGLGIGIRKRFIFSNLLTLLSDIKYYTIKEIQKTNMGIPETIEIRDTEAEIK